MDSRTRIVFLRGDGWRPVGCVAIHVEPGSATLRYGLSVLNPTDNFDRKMARHLALGRLVEIPHTLKMHRHGGELTMHDITTMVMIDLVNRKGVPNRAAKAAKWWLLRTEMLDQDC
jgi:hypothetical protein